MALRPLVCRFSKKKNARFVTFARPNGDQEKTNKNARIYLKPTLHITMIDKLAIQVKERKVTKETNEKSCE